MTATTVKRPNTRKTRPVKRVVTAKPLTEATRLKELRAFVNICFALLSTKDDKVDVKDVAKRTTLSQGTVYKLMANDFSLRVQFRTIQALGAAAGLKLEWNKYAFRVYVTD
jgi:hypothetical protein